MSVCICACIEVFFYNTRELFVPGTVEAIADDVSLVAGKSYYSVVRATNMLGHVTTIRSDGVRVVSAPSSAIVPAEGDGTGACTVVPGTVKDGSAVDRDVNFQTSTTSLSANWDGFDTCVNGEGDH